ncbi:MAG: GspH/FimT family pseudopilin [Rubrivivax sp.]|jgi:type IV fimbrial biogenesis protein FimT|nr:GspH/FimT family pseudopilin [Rubrivivax sp.]
MSTPPASRSRSLGLTLIEIAIVLAVLAVLATLAVPSLGHRLARERLAATAERLAADVAEARFDAARRGQPLYVHATLGTATCWSIATTPGCDCQSVQTCQVRRMPASSSSGVRTVQAQDVRLDPGGTAAPGTAAVLEIKSGEQLRVDVLALGRTRICSLNGPAAKYPAC